MPESFVSALIGGALIGLAATLLMLTNGRVAGVSGLLSGLLRASPDRAHQLFFIGGLAGAGALFAVFRPEALQATGVALPLPLIGLAGILVGFGTSLSGGCTSGHGVCGMSRFSVRSIVATMLFMATGVTTVAIVRTLGWLS